MSIAVIGAGLAGLSVARHLTELDFGVVLFDKSRGVGGRLATRRRPDPSRPFDHGAQFFTARDPGFRKLVDELVALGVVAPWKARWGRHQGARLGAWQPPGTRYVGVPAMRAMARHLARDLDIRGNTRIAKVEGRLGDRWLVDTEGTRHGPFANVLVAVPAPQAAPLLADSPALQAHALAQPMVPCLATMVSFAEPVATDFDAIHLRDAPLSFVARNNSKPGRPPTECWVLHADEASSQAHLEEPPSALAPRMVGWLEELLGVDLPPVIEATAHRWRYARPDEGVSTGVSHGWDVEQGLGSCGDWWQAGRVEAAWLSGRQLAEAIDRCTD